LHATAEFTSSKTTLIGWEIYFYSDIFISTALLVFPPTWGTPAIFLLAKRYRQNAKFKKKTNSKKQWFWRLSVARTEGEKRLRIASFIYLVFIV
jgi:hypothetical protein